MLQIKTLKHGARINPQHFPSLRAGDFFIYALLVLLVHNVLDGLVVHVYNKIKINERGAARFPVTVYKQVLMKGARLMKNIKLADQISELKTTICSLKAVATAFDRSYTEGTPQQNIVAVQIDQENYCYLFNVITDLIADAKDKVTDLEATIDEQSCTED